MRYAFEAHDAIYLFGQVGSTSLRKGDTQSLSTVTPSASALGRSVRPLPARATKTVAALQGKHATLSGQGSSSGSTTLEPDLDQEDRDAITVTVSATKHKAIRDAVLKAFDDEPNHMREVLSAWSKP